MTRRAFYGWMVAIIVLGVCFIAVVAQADQCHVNNKGVFYAQVPYAVPVGVPVAAFVPSYSYQHPAAGQYNAQPSYQQDPEWAEFKAWKARKQVAPAASVFGQRCASCHSGGSPKGSFSLKTATARQLLRAIERVADGSMPPKQRLTGDENGKVIHELATMKAKEKEDAVFHDVPAPPVPERSEPSVPDDER